MQGMTPTAQNTKHGFLKQEKEETQSTQKIVILNKNIDMRSGSSDLGQKRHLVVRNDGIMESKTVTYDSEQEYTYRRGAGNGERMMHRDYLNIVDGVTDNTRNVSHRSKVKRTRNRDINATNDELYSEKKGPFKKEDKRNMKASLASLEIDGRKLIPPEKAKVINRTIIMSNSPSF